MSAVSSKDKTVLLQDSYTSGDGGKLHFRSPTVMEAPIRTSVPTNQGGGAGFARGTTTMTSLLIRPFEMEGESYISSQILW